jgi:rubrerythrin
MNMAKLEGTKTHENLKEAFAGESQANRRYLYFAKVADVEGLPEVAGLFKDTADGETGHAHGHLETARDEGFGEIAEWFETLAKAEKSHAGRFDKAFKELS